MEIKVKYYADIDRIEKIEIGDWIDLRTAKDVFIEPWEYKEIPLGIAMELPEGYEAHIVPRSSTFRKYGIIMTNSVGIIDNSYCGNGDIWHFPALLVAPKLYAGFHPIGTRIPANTRICQFRIMPKMPDVEFVEVKSLDGKTRGGLGATG